MRHLLIFTFVCTLLAITPPGVALAQRGKGPPFADPAFQVDRTLFQYLLSHRAEIERQIKNLDNGVETITESANPAVAARIQEHAYSMHKRAKENRPIHLRDPLFAEIFRHAHKIEWKMEKTPNGIRVRQTSNDPYAARLAQAHARVVSLFLANGHTEVHKNHPLPPKE